MTKPDPKQQQKAADLAKLLAKRYSIPLPKVAQATAPPSDPISQTPTGAPGAAIFAATNALEPASSGIGAV